MIVSLKLTKGGETLMSILLNLKVSSDSRLDCTYCILNHNYHSILLLDSLLFSDEKLLDSGHWLQIKSARLIFKISKAFKRRQMQTVVEK